MSKIYTFADFYKVDAKEDDDPYVMYIVIRESLDMSPGKVVAQVGHAVQMISFHQSVEAYNMPSELSSGKLLAYDRWLAQNSTKIVLKADEKEWAKLKGEGGYLVIDAGKNELIGQNETVMGCWPMRRSERSKLLKRLQVYK